MLSKPELIAHTMCRIIQYNYLVFDGHEIPQKRDKSEGGIILPSIAVYQYSNDQNVSSLLLRPGHPHLALFSILLCHQIWLWFYNICISIAPASLVSLHLCKYFTVSPLPSILMGNFQSSSSHLNVHRQNSHEAPFYSSDRAWILMLQHQITVA